MSHLNMDALRSAEFHADPYPYAHYQNAFHEVDKLTDAFPTTGFEPHAQRRLLEAIGKKGSPDWYRNNVFTRALLELGETRAHEPDGLAEVWLELADELTSAEYRERLSELTGLDVRPMRMQAHFWRFEDGASFKPHVDKPHKVVTHLMYLTENWTPEMGGCFRVLRSDDHGDVHAEIPPRPNNAIVLRRTDHAWHSVSSVPLGQRPRKLLQVWFWGE
jgi:hypothetical protein